MVNERFEVEAVMRGDFPRDADAVARIADALEEHGFLWDAIILLDADEGTIVVSVEVEAVDHETAGARFVEAMDEAMRRLGLAEKVRRRQPREAILELATS